MTADVVWCGQVGCGDAGGAGNDPAAVARSPAFAGLSVRVRHLPSRSGSARPPFDENATKMSAAAAAVVANVCVTLSRLGAVARGTVSAPFQVFIKGSLESLQGSVLGL